MPAELPQSATGMGCTGCAARAVGLCRAWLSRGLEDSVPGLPAITQFERAVPARRLVFRASECRDYVPVICAGWGAVVAYLPSGQRQILSFPLPGEFVSPSLIFADGPARDVEAVTPVRCRTFDRTKVREQMIGRPKFLKKIFEDCFEEKERLAELVIDLGRRRAEERVARLVLHLMQRLGKHDMASGGTIDFPLRQAHIADALGLTPVYINQILQNFRDDGIFEIANRKLRVLDPVKLHLAANK